MSQKENQFVTATDFTRRFKHFKRWIAVPLIVFICLLVLFMALTKQEKTIQANGTMATSQRGRALYVQGPATITQVMMQFGQRVRKNQPILVYRVTADTDRIDDLASQITDLKKQQKQLQMFGQSVDQNKNLFSEADQYGYQQAVQTYLNQRQMVTQTLSGNAAASDNQALTNKRQEVDQLLTTMIAQTATEIGQIQVAEAAIRGQGSVAADNPYAGFYQHYQQAVATADAAGKAAIQTQDLAQLQGRLNDRQKQLAALQAQQQENQQTTGTGQASAETLLTTLQTITEQTLAADAKRIQQTLGKLEAKDNDLRHAGQPQTIKAPVTGLIYFRQSAVADQQIVAKRQVIGRILPEQNHQSSISFTLKVAKKDVSSVKCGQQVRVKVEPNAGDTLILTGKVTQIPSTNQLQQGALQITVQSRVSQSQLARLHDGITAQASIVTGSQSSWQALVRNRGI
ncbi:HlyD family secretion protein [Lacticaseibacillus casei]|jgi:competence factor transport accessory protein ComB|uniref:HlyD family secretion protein n=1 Tax=Lacticaseibacillus huelsenbergensis TaxID=3035291 RepID=A0ABY8DS39_9LACO|nr:MULTISPECIES: HlyD family secretion protein [Lacticaseibacillus]MDG3061505.1 HlyD family secretion protein [Lacticaseibacillus sp. BCRC 81376]QVI36956.1 HlyD family efflux transporter periplasmic adaptor subunit [Lacticaseibacillus casei]QXG58746.1 HlyD family secretion protein [Lacticaseibacillus casei]WFB39811.1 HlyD family secretion protein [Lacticaseibacillus huelsenbergensis]WFB41510.1 HlyD family secretion protein [Lacticaseibacillus huelsenbergensis]